MKKKLLLFASMLMMVPFMAFAAKTVGVKVTMADQKWDWDLTKVDAQYGTVYDVWFFIEGQEEEPIEATPMKYENSGDTIWYVMEPVKFADDAKIFVGCGKETDFASLPSFRSQSYEVKDGSKAFVMSMAEEQSLSETDPSKWYTVLTPTTDPEPWKEAAAEVEPPYSNKNLLSVDQYNFNDGNPGWAYEPWGNNKGTISIAVPGFGESAGALQLATAAVQGNDYEAQALLKNLNIPAGDYIISFYAKADKAGAPIKFGIKNTVGWPNTYEVMAAEVELTTDWVKYELYVNTTEATMVMEVNHGHALGNVYIDCLSITGEEPANTRDNLFNDNQYNFNNGEIEWYYLGWNNEGTAKAAESGFMGSKSALLLNATSKKSNDYSAQILFNLPNEVPAGEYTLSFWAKAEEAEAEIKFGIKDAASWPNTYEVNTPAIALSQTWVKYTYKITTAQPTTLFEINHGFAPGNVLIDCVSLTEFEPRYDERNILTIDQYNFNNDNPGWAYEPWGNNKGTISIAEPGLMGSAGALQLATTAVQGNDYEAQALLKNLTIPAGYYFLSFYAKADTEGAPIKFGIKNTVGWPNTYEVMADEVALTTDWVKYQLLVCTNEPTMVMEVNHGHALGNVYIDCVELLPVPTTVVEEIDFSKVAAGAFPAGWKANDNGTVQEYNNTYGSGPRTFDGFSGQFEKAVYWRNTGAAFGDGYLSYGEQEDYKLHLVPATYMIEFINLNWSNPGTDKYAFELNGVDNSFSYLQEFETVPNPAGHQTKGAISDVPVQKLFLDIATEGDYVVKFSGANSWNGFLLGSFSMIGFYEEEAPEGNPEAAIEGNLLTDADAYFNDEDPISWFSCGVNDLDIKKVNPGWDNTIGALSFKNAKAGVAYDAQLAINAWNLIGADYGFFTTYNYTISFMAKADAAAKMQITLEYDGEPWFGDVYEETLNLTDEWQEYTIEMRPSEYGLSRLILNVGEVAATYFIDHVAITRSYAYDVDENDENNMLQGDDFNFDGLTTGNWSVIDGEDAGKLAAVQCETGDAFNAPGILQFTPARTGAIYASQIYIENEFKKDYTYDFWFAAKYEGVDEDNDEEYGKLQVSFQPASNPWYGDVYPSTFYLPESSWWANSGSLTITGEENIRFIISLGEVAGTYSIDHVVIIETAPSGEIQKPTEVEVSEFDSDDVIINAQGQRVSTMIKGNVYMVNGKKILF